MARKRTRLEVEGEMLDRRIHAETILIPQEIIPYNNFEEVSKGAFPIVQPVGLSPQAR